MKSWLDSPLAKAINAQLDSAAAAEPSRFEPTQPKTNTNPMTRIYASAIPNRFNNGFPSYNLSADAEMVTSLLNLRSASRKLVRDAAFAKAAKRTIINNVIGTGVKLQPAVKTAKDTLSRRVNAGITREFDKWCHAGHCHTGGALHLHDMERMLMGQVFEAGEILVRMWPQKFGDSKIPLGLEIIEPERLADGYAQPGGSDGRAIIRMGVEVDQFKRPIAYWVRDLHPGDVRLNVERTDHYTRVPAEDMFHLKITDRWPQTRGEPWLHAVASKLRDIDGYSEAEIIAARGAASYMATIESPEAPTVFAEQSADKSLQFQLEPGTTFKLNPGEKLNFNSPNRSNAGMEPFMTLMLREVSAGLGISYEALSNDYSKTNYSSSRLSLLNERDAWRALQMWFIRSFRHRLHKRWLQQAVYSGQIPEIAVADYAINTEKFEECFFRPRGWQWVDPTKEVSAYKDAVKGGFITVGQVIAQTAGGDDIEDVMEARAAELEYFDELQLAFDTSPEVYVPAESRGQVLLNADGDTEPAAVVTAEQLQAKGLNAAPGATPGAPSGVAVKPDAKPVAKAAPDEDNEPASADGEDDARSRVVSFNRRNY